MTAPQHIHRMPRNDRSMSEAIKTVQGTSVARREVKITLVKAPWEKEESE